MRIFGNMLPDTFARLPQCLVTEISVNTGERDVGKLSLGAAVLVAIFPAPGLLSL
jgi:hypothetical protein